MRIFLVIPCSFTLMIANGFVAESATIAPHRAIYDIAFKEASAKSKINGGGGKWVMELTGAACTGYNISYRFVTQLTYEDGNDLLIDTRGKNFENGEGTAFDFSNSTYQNNKLLEEIKGIASKQEAAIDVKLSRPERAGLTLKGDILFPAQHFVRLIEQAKAGEKVVSSTVYEGVEGAKEAMDVTAVIAPEKPLEDGAGKPYQELEEKNLRRWPVSLSYFKTGATTDTTPEWQNSFLLYENGVSRDFVFNYGDFSLTGTLTNLELLPEENCS